MKFGICEFFAIGLVFIILVGEVVCSYLETTDKGPWRKDRK